MAYLLFSTLNGVDLAHLDGLLLYVTMGLFQVYEGNGLAVMEIGGKASVLDRAHNNASYGRRDS